MARLHCPCETSIVNNDRGSVQLVGKNRKLSVSWRNIAVTVRREKALVHSEKKDSPGNWIAPPGSNRSGGGGNKAAEASGGEGRIRRLGESAGCNVTYTVSILRSEP